MGFQGNFRAQDHFLMSTKHSKAKADDNVISLTFSKSKKNNNAQLLSSVHSGALIQPDLVLYDQ